MYKKIVLAIISICAFVFVIYFIQKEPITTMKYFPIDESHYFAKAATYILYLQSDENHNVQWITESKSNKNSYLRQDISLLYENGKFKGIQNKWEQNVTEILLQQSYKQTKSSLLQTISFHHGEIHYKDESIKSIQKMTNDHLYFVNSDEEITTFHTPSTKTDKKWAKTLNHITKKHLVNDWNDIIEHYGIQRKNYVEIPLTALFQFDEQPITGLSMKETDQIIGQLWEGIYENYVTLLTDNSKQHAHSVPLILMAKDNSHLLVLFQLNDEKFKLIQKFPS